MTDRDVRLSGISETDQRSAFQRDRDRVLYSAHFRRLGGVTQVTSPTELYGFHNRLTHTLEVAQIARRMAERFVSQGISDVDPDVCETAALIHDLGHPPFGHNGEKSLDRLALGRGDEDGYEGNAQSFRIVTKLAVRAAGSAGLDLTKASLRACLKYPSLKADATEEGKYGVFKSESEAFHSIYDTAPHKTLEAQIMDWADDIAYSVHDLYDFVLAGVVPLREIASFDAPKLRAVLDNRKLDSVADSAFDSVLFELNVLLPSSLDLASTSRFSSELVGKLKEWVSANIYKFSEHGCQVFNGKLQSDTEVVHQVAILKALTYHFAIGSPALAVRQQGEQTILRGLFKYLWCDLKQPKPSLFSREALDRLQVEQRPARIVCDAISSMTDAQAITLYHKLTGISPSSILDTSTPSML